MGATRSGDIRVEPAPPPVESVFAAGWPAIRVTAAGAMQLARMPWAAPATLRLRVSPITPPLAVAYDRLLGRPNNPEEVVITMRP